jgi:cytochrome P450
VAAGGIPHMLTQNDTYKDFVFPAGTIFFANTWAIHHDEDEYSEPNAFNPDRWLDNKFGTKEGNAAADAGNEQRKITYSWGAGRRICSGQKLAENALRIMIAKIVWALNVTKAEGKENEEVDTSPLSAYQGGFLIAPNKFPVKITPRSEERANVLEQEFRGLRPYFDKFDVV